METEKTFADSKRTVCLGTGEAKFEVEIYTNEMRLRPVTLKLPEAYS